MDPKSSDAQTLLNAVAGVIPAGSVTAPGQDGGGTAVIPGTDPAPLPKKGTPTAGAGNPPPTPATPNPPVPVDPVVMDTPLGRKTFGVSSTGQQVVLNSFEDLQAVSKGYGVELSRVEDVVDVIKNFSVVNSQVKELQTVKQQYDNLTGVINRLPPEVMAIVQAAANSQDYTPILQSMAKRGAMNLDKPVDSYSDRELVNHYGDQKYDKETFDSLDDNTRSAFIRMARAKYIADQTEHQTAIRTTQSNAQAHTQRFTASVEGSISRLKANNPEMGEAVLNRVRDVLTAELHRTLFRPDNTYQDDAAEKIAMMLYGRETILKAEHTIADLVNKYRSAGASQATEQILLASDKPVLKGSGAQPGADWLSAEVDKTTSFMKVRG